jgi:hypothetical protein
LIEPLRHIHNPEFGAVIFRRTYPQIRSEGGLWSESMTLYPAMGGQPRESMLDWAFSDGGRIKFAHMQHEINRLDWQGAQIPLIEFDELTQFTKEQFFYMFSRNRSGCGVKPYIRATTNPDSDSWVADLIEWWIDQESGYAIPERSGVIRWFVRDGNTLIWFDSREEAEEAYPTIPPKSFTFIAASLYDNPALMNADPGYLANLMALPLVEREQLLGDKKLGGNWKIKPAAGKVFNRGWFEIVEAVPSHERKRRRVTIQTLRPGLGFARWPGSGM